MQQQERCPWRVYSSSFQGGVCLNPVSSKGGPQGIGRAGGSLGWKQGQQSMETGDCKPMSTLTNVRCGYQRDSSRPHRASHISADPSGPGQTNFLTAEPENSTQNKGLHSWKPDLSTATGLHDLPQPPTLRHMTPSWGRAGKRLRNLKD